MSNILDFRKKTEKENWKVQKETATFSVFFNQIRPVFWATFRKSFILLNTLNLQRLQVTIIHKTTSGLWTPLTPPVDRDETMNLKDWDQVHSEPGPNQCKLGTKQGTRPGPFRSALKTKTNLHFNRWRPQKGWPKKDGITPSNLKTTRPTEA